MVIIYVFFLLSQISCYTLAYDKSFIFNLPHNLLTSNYPNETEIISTSLLETYTLNTTLCSKMNSTINYSKFNDTPIPLLFLYNNCSNNKAIFTSPYYVSLSLATLTTPNSFLYQIKPSLEFLTIFAHKDRTQFFGFKRKNENDYYVYNITNDTWTCEFDTICINERCSVKYKNSQRMLIEPFLTTLVPFDFLELVRDTYYKKEFQSGNCKFDNYNNSTLIWIVCDNDVASHDFPITFLKNREGVTIKKTKVSTVLFSYYDNNEWILSADLIPSLFFDFDNKMILFYDVAHIHRIIIDYFNLLIFAILLC